MTGNNIPRKCVPRVEIDHHSRECRLGLERAFQLLGRRPIKHSGLKLRGVDARFGAAFVIGGSIIIIWVLA